MKDNEIIIPRSLFCKMSLLTILALEDYPRDHDEAIETLTRYVPADEIDSYVGDHVSLEGE